MWELRNIGNKLEKSWVKCEKLQGLSSVIQELKPFGSKHLQMEKSQTGHSAYPSTVKAAGKEAKQKRDGL